MRTRTENIEQAEKHVLWAAEDDYESPEERFHVGMAQVHATLALVAAVAELREMLEERSS